MTRPKASGASVYGRIGGLSRSVKPSASDISAAAHVYINTTRIRIQGGNPTDKLDHIHTTIDAHMWAMVCALRANIPSIYAGAIWDHEELARTRMRQFDDVEARISIQAVGTTLLGSHIPVVGTGIRGHAR